MRVAALYDIHGNLPALEAVLAEVERAGVDRIVVGGDVAAGPYPSDVVARLESLGERVVFIRGNADRELYEAGDRIPEALREPILSRVTDELRETLASWPEQARLDVDGLGDVLFCHATPRNDEEIFTELTPDEVVAEMFAAAPRVTVVGHTHMQVDRRLGDKRIVNAGSVGIPYEGRPGAYWAILGPDVEFRRTEYDVEKLVQVVVDSGFPAEELYRESLIEPSARRAVAEFFESLRTRA